MLDVVLITAGLIALAVVLLSVRLLCGKCRFVHTHIDGNKALNRQGIFCAKEQDRAQRRHNGLVIREKNIETITNTCNHSTKFGPLP